MKKTLLGAAVIALLCAFTLPDEGMFPVSKLSGINLKKAGIKLSAEQIFSEKGGAVSDALVRLGGCTGSFVSSEGMIITNHHCVFGSVSRLSTPENNYLRDGFHAPDKDKELHTGLPARITISSRDVSSDVLKGLSGLSGSERDKKLAGNTQALLRAEKQKDSLYTYEISEMFKGKQYVLFKYLTLLDVRLVYVPPRYIGEFGAETDNWEWPRHTGDFSIVRAYIGKDGKPAKYSKDNVPFKPNRHLKINPNGTQENDAVFILGYPGRTYRHQPYQFLKYQNDKFMPAVVDWFQWRINKMHELSANDEATYLGFAGTIKGLANTEKNFRGKLQGLARTSVLADKQALDNQLQTLAMEEENKEKYGKVLKSLEGIYGTRTLNFDADFYLSRLLRDVPPVAAAMEAYVQTLKGEGYKHENFLNHYRQHNHELNLASIKYLLPRINKGYESTHYGARLTDQYSDRQIEKMYAKSIYPQYTKKVVPYVTQKSKKLYRKKDPLYKLCEKLYPAYREMQKRYADFKASNDLLMPLYTELKMKSLKTNFIPDANSTLRFTYGRVKGYSPNDGEYHYPHTTLRGVLQKANSMPDYKMPADALAVYNQSKVASQLLDKKSGKVIVGLLYNLDTTGGNSGSPVMDAEGNLVGINFDRAYTATINDYAWNDKYSRSIAVDIRYVLYVIKYIGKANNVLDELQIKL